MNQENLSIRTNMVFQAPLQKFCGITLKYQSTEYAECVFRVGENTGTPFGTIHGGVLYAMMDVASLCALLPYLNEKEHAVSHTVNFSLMDAAKEGDEVSLRARVLRRGKRVAFISVEAFVPAENGKKQIACGNITKTIIHFK